MSLNIKNAETYRLVKELAAVTGESMTTAVKEAVRERLARIRAAEADADTEIEARIQRIEAIAAVIREHSPPGYWDQDFDELLYDERGLPR